MTATTRNYLGPREEQLVAWCALPVVAAPVGSSPSFASDRPLSPHG